MQQRGGAEFHHPYSKLLGLVWFAGAACSPASQPPSLNLAADPAVVLFAEQIVADVEKDAVASIAAGICIEGDLSWSGAWGLADRTRGIVATPDTIYRIGSISKSFTAVALIQSAERGILQLDDAVATYLPEVAGLIERPEGSQPITLRQLASHTTGIIREPTLEGAAAGPIEGWKDKILASLPTTAFQSFPGERYSYSNIGFGILGLAVSRATGLPFMELVHTQVIDPLEMRSTVFVITEDLRPFLSTGYANRRDGTIDAERPAREHEGRGYKVPNGGIYSTVGDLCRFAGGSSGVSAVDILSMESRAEMLRIQTPESDHEGYGLGFSVQVDEDGSRVVGHGGSVAGYTAHLAFEPRAGVGVVLLRNYNRGVTDLGNVARRLVRKLSANRQAWQADTR